MRVSIYPEVFAEGKTEGLINFIIAFFDGVRYMKWIYDLRFRI